METMNTITGISDVALSAASLLVMVFGIRLGKKALSKNETLFGEEAEKRVKAIEDKLPRPYSVTKWEGGNKIVRYYYKGDNDQTMVKTWRLK